LYASNPHVSTAITEASRTAQVVENMKAMEIIPQLNAALWQKIDEAVGKISVE
jgi:aryl-alcohol dehydrogenase-like predicted oxidoreductase